MTVLSGRGGAVDGESCVREWRIAVSAELSEYAGSNTDGMVSALEGNEDWSGSFSGYGATPVAMPGEAMAFVGSIDGSVGAAGTAIVDSVEITADIEGRKPIEYVVNFSRNGALTLGTAEAEDTTTLLAPQADENCVVKLGTLASPAVFTALADVRNWKLTISAANPSYVSSSTSGGKARFAGNLSVSFSVGVYCGTFATLPAVNTVKALQFYVNATEYWQVLWGVFGEASDLLVNREQVNVVGATLNGRMTAVRTIGSTVTKGSITKPGGASAWWPAA